MSVALELSDLAFSFEGSLDGGDQDISCDRRVQPVRFDISEVQPAKLVGRCMRADRDTTRASSVCEENHLQERCVDLATELFAVKSKFDELENELKEVQRQGDAKDRDLKELQRVCDEDRRSSRSLMRTVKALEDVKSKLSDQNAELRMDKDRLLAVVRRHTEAGRTESIAAHRERLRRRPMLEKEVNKCDIAAAKLELKTVRRENQRLLADARRQAGRSRTLEDDTTMLARKVAELKQELETSKDENASLRRDSDATRAAERQAAFDSDREVTLRLEAVEKASAAERDAEKAREDASTAELEAESLRAQLIAAAKQLSTKDSARARHQGSVARYQAIIDAQALALQSARQQLLSEKIKRQESERQARLRHIAIIDSKNRATVTTSAFPSTTEPRGSRSPTGRAAAGRRR